LVGVAKEAGTSVEDIWVCKALWDTLGLVGVAKEAGTSVEDIWVCRALW